MPAETSKTGFQTVGKYELVEKIAEGGMGTVYKARERGGGPFVAIKIMPANTASNTILLKRFEQEYNAAKALDHPNIVHAIEFAFHNNCPYLVMEYVDGESLGQRLERITRLPENEAIRIIGQVAQGLHKAHKFGLVHRDIKPDNILLTKDGQVKLTDLGLVKEMETDLNLTRTGRGLGTPYFMAPEQFRNAKKADPRCDIYSMAATLYMMVTGELPFKSSGPLDAYMKKVNNEIKPPRQVVPTLSERLDWAVRRSLSVDPSLRAGTCREFVEDITGHSTRRIPLPGENEGIPDLWFLCYRDEEGVSHTVKGTQSAIRNSFREGLLGDASNIRASRAKGGPFDLLRNFPEFRDLVLDLQQPSTPPSSQSEPKWTSPASPNLPLIPVAPPLAPAVTENPDLGSGHWPTLPSTSAGGEGAQDNQGMWQPATPVPHINLGKSKASPEEWTKWAVLLLFAAAAGVMVFFLLPLLGYRIK